MGMPIIFASAVLVLPSSLSGFAQDTAIGGILNQVSLALRPGNIWYVITYSLMILFFSYFYASLISNPEDIAQNLKKMGSSIPGIRPGKSTINYLEGVLNRLTLLGAIFLTFVAIVPTFFS